MKRKRKGLKSRRKVNRDRDFERRLPAIMNEMYRAAAEQAADFIFMIDNKNRILTVNNSAAALLGKTPKEVEGKSIFDMFPTDVATEFSKGLGEVFETGKGRFDSDFRIVAGDRELWINTRLDPVTDTEGRVSAVMGVSRDVTERRHVEEWLHESEEKYKAMVENSPNLIGIIQDGVLKYVNSSVTLNLGWTNEELLSPSFDPIAKVVSENSKTVLKENIARRLRGESIPPYEVSVIRKDGSRVPVLVRASKILYNQRPAIEFVFDDISDRKRMEGKVLALHKHVRPNSALQIALTRSLTTLLTHWSLRLDSITFISYWLKITACRLREAEVTP